MSNVNEFENCFELEIEIYIKDFKKNYHIINEEASKMCIDIIVNNIDSFKRIKMCVNEAGEKDRNDLSTNPISLFFVKLIKNIPFKYKDQRQSIETNELDLSCFDQKYFHLVLANW